MNNFQHSKKITSLFEWESNSRLFGSCGLDNSMILYDYRFSQPISSTRMESPLPSCLKTRDHKLAIATHGKNHLIQIFDLRKLDKVYKTHMGEHIETDVKKYVQSRTHQILYQTNNSTRRFTDGNLNLKGSLFQNKINKNKKILNEFERFQNNVDRDKKENSLASIWNSGKRDFFFSPLIQEADKYPLLRNSNRPSLGITDSKFSSSMNQKLINQFNSLIGSLSKNCFPDNEIFRFQSPPEESIRAIEMLDSNF